MPRGERRRPTVLWLLWGFISLQVIVVSAVVLVALTNRDAASGYRLRAKTMLPAELSVRPDDLTCPSTQSVSPVDYLDAGALARSLPLYDGDLIAVRILTVPTGTDADEIVFSADWPASVVGEGQPSCAFVVGDGSNPAVVSWEEDPEVGTRFVLANAAPGVPTEIEVWLEADDPIQGTTFQTALFPESRSDDVVLDPLGGRVDIDRRPGSTPTLSVVAEPVDAEAGLFDVVARVRNDSPRTRSLDVLLRLSAPSGPTWTVTDDASSNRPCLARSALECAIGDLSAGEEVQVAARVQMAAGWAPLAVSCDGPPGDVGFGLCIEAAAQSDAPGADTTARASALVALPRPPAEDLEIRTDPAQVIGRVGRPVEFDFAISTAGLQDLGSVTIVGTDCLGTSRESQPLEDGDAFLEAGETWIYPCEFDLEDAATFRFDVAATGVDGQRVTASYEGNVQVIAPELDVVIVDGEAGRALEVRNGGIGRIRNVAVLLPACDSVALLDGDPTRIDEGEAVRLDCTDESGSFDGATAYGIDDLDSMVLGTLR